MYFYGSLSGILILIILVLSTAVLCLTYYIRKKRAVPVPTKRLQPKGQMKLPGRGQSRRVGWQMAGEGGVSERTHSSRSYLGRRCRFGLRQAHPASSSRLRYGKKESTGAKAAMPAPLAWVLAHCPHYTVKRAALRLYARRQVRCYQALCLLKNGASP